MALVFSTTPGEAQLGVNCSITTGGVAFGAYDVFSAAPVDAAGSVTFQCTLGASVVVQLGTGSAGTFTPRTMRRSGEPLNYNLYLDAARTQVWGNGTAGTNTHSNFVTILFPVVVPIHARIFCRAERHGRQLQRFSRGDDRLLTSRRASRSSSRAAELLLPLIDRDYKYRNTTIAKVLLRTCAIIWLMMETFAAAEVETGETTIFIRSAGTGPPVLLLHGFPQTHLMWRHVAPLLARTFTVVCADLRGYGRSGCPPSTGDHAPYAKRAMARDMIEVMDRLGFPRFSVAGHDRGGRVAYRIAIDHPDRVDHLAVLDVLPSEAAWERADARFMLEFWPWALFAQPAPLPERILETTSDAIVDHALEHWGSSPDVFSAEVRMAYAGALREGAHPHAICEEYRASATIDRSHDRAFWEGGRRIGCPTLVLWSGRGPLDIRYADDGGPIALWQGWSDDVQGHPLAAGHFFPEEAPEETAEALNLFFQTRAARPVS